jgi:hypothetical protein
MSMQAGNFIYFEKLLPQYITDRHNDDDCQSIRWQFPNGYGASLVYHPMSYGEQPEFAALRGNKLCYDTDVAPDVISRDCVEYNAAL